ncbi:MAG: hypothetical protein V4620_05535 [Bacteroidota bacterium]
MDTNKNDKCNPQNDSMSKEKVNPLAVLTLLFLSSLLSSCEIIGGIFKAGMSFGIFIVVAIIVIIVFLIMKAGKK